MQVPADMEIAYIPCTSAGSYPGLYLATTPSRFTRTVKQMFGDGSLELIGPLEQVNQFLVLFYFYFHNIFAFPIGVLCLSLFQILLI